MNYKVRALQRVTGIVLLLFVFSSCDGVLDNVPSDKVTIDRILNKNTVENFRSNSYNNLNSTFNAYYAGQLLEAYSDDAFRAGTGVPFDWHNNLLTPENNLFVSTLWNQNWQGIRKTNLALKYLPQSKAPKDIVSDQEINLWMDEVRVLRAWYHFNLIKNFGPVPFIDQVFEPDFVGWTDLTRPTFNEISTRIVDELNEVISNGRLPMRWQSSSNYDKINMAVAYALKSRVLLYNASALNNPSDDQARWQQAADAAQQAIDNIGGEYGLVPMNEYGTLFNQSIEAFNQEIILRSGNNGAGVMNNLNGVDLSFLGSPTQSNNAGAVPTQELVDGFELTDGTLPVASYNSPDHTNPAFNTGYSENSGDDPYNGRDARLSHAVVFNGSNYGKYKGMGANEPELTIYTYEGKPGTGFNSNPLSDDDATQRRSATGYYGKKFRSAIYWGSTTGGANAHKIYFRMAELYLNLAEAQAQLGNLGASASALNVVRTRAGQPEIENVPGFTNTQEFLLDRIRNERRVELCFEGHRFYDQRRWMILGSTNDVISGMKVTSSDGTDNGTFSYTRVHLDVPREAVSDKYLVLPLPSEEARRLTGLGQPEAWQ